MSLKMWVGGRGSLTKFVFLSTEGKQRLTEGGREGERMKYLLIINMFPQLKKNISTTGTTFSPVLPTCSPPFPAWPLAPRPRAAPHTRLPHILGAQALTEVAAPGGHCSRPLSHRCNLPLGLLGETLYPPTNWGWTV